MPALVRADALLSTGDSTGDVSLWDTRPVGHTLRFDWWRAMYPAPFASLRCRAKPEGLPYTIQNACGIFQV